MKQRLGILILYYLRFFARLQLKKNDPIIIGITGSAGKTSLRRATSLILSQKGRVKESHRANSESGIPLNILGLTLSNYSLFDWLRVLILAPYKLLTNWEKFDYYIVEMGIDSPRTPKNMGYLLTILSPDIGVVLNAGLTHTAEFDYLVKDKNPRRRSDKISRLIAQEKGRLVTEMTDSRQVAILNYDQPHVRALGKNTNARTLTFGTSKRADLRIIKVSQKQASFSTTIQYHGKNNLLEFKNLSFESNYAHTFAAALAIGTSLGIPPSRGTNILERGFSAPPGRWSIFAGKKNSHIIDSSYNASPATTQQALTELRKLAGKKNHKIAVLGDMRELGQETKQAHKDLADWIIGNTNQALLFGEATRDHTLSILKSKKHPAKHYPNISDLIFDLKSSLTEGSWILVKGSQNTLFLERVVAAILKNKKDINRLCRRGKYWDRIRAKTP